MKIELTPKEVLFLIDDLESTECEYGYDSERCALINRLIEQYNKPEPEEIDVVHQMAVKVWEERQKILDLFCQTFVAAQEPKSIDEIKVIFRLCCLECKIMDNMTQRFTVKLKDDV